MFRTIRLVIVLFLGLGLVGLFILALPTSAEKDTLESQTYIAQNVELVGSLEGNFQYIIIEGNYAYVNQSDNLGGYFGVIDISDPLNPVQIGSIELDAYSSLLAAANGYAYIKKGSSLVVLDVSDPSNPIQMSSYGFTHSLNHMAVEGFQGYLTLGACFFGCSGGMLVLDISDPGNPVQLGSYSNRPVGEIAVLGEHAYVAALGFSSPYFMSGLWVLDISDPSFPYEVYTSTLQFESYFTDLIAQGRYLYKSSYFDDKDDGTSSGFSIWDISDPADPGYVGGSGGCTSELSKMGELLYGSCYKGLQVFDVSDASDPITVGSFNTSEPAKDVASADGYVYLTAENGLFVLRYAISETITSDLGGILNYDDQGDVTTIQVPPEAVTDTTTLFYAPVPGFQPPPGKALVGDAFELTAYQDGVRQPETVFSSPLTVTINYSDEDMRVVSEEEDLGLYWWSGSAWEDASTTCELPATVSHDLEDNVFRVSICHISRFAFLGPTNHRFLPFVER